MLGFDCVYVPSGERDETLMVLSALTEKRTVLTRSAGLARSCEKAGAQCIFPESQNWRLQLAETIRRLDLGEKDFNWFSRCLSCNEKLEKAPPSRLAEIKKEILEREKEFFACPFCGKIYWNASHVDNSKKLLQRILNET